MAIPIVAHFQQKKPDNRHCWGFFAIFAHRRPRMGHCQMLDSCVLLVEVLNQDLHLGIN
jgi:hypothetical protein